MGRLLQKMARGVENTSILWLQHLLPQQNSPLCPHLSLYPETPLTWEGPSVLLEGKQPLLWEGTKNAV